MVIRCRGANRALVSLVPFVRSAGSSNDRPSDRSKLLRQTTLRTVSAVELAKAFRGNLLTSIVLARQTLFAFPVARFSSGICSKSSRICSKRARVDAERSFRRAERLRE